MKLSAISFQHRNNDHNSRHNMPEACCCDNNQTKPLDVAAFTIACLGRASQIKDVQIAKLKAENAQLKHQLNTVI